MAALRYIAALVISGGFWIAVAFGLGSVLEGMIPFQVIDPADFRNFFTLAIGIAALGALILCWIWLAYGGRDLASTNLGAAKGTWRTLLVLSIADSIAILAHLFVHLRGEPLSFVVLLLMYLGAATASWIAFWLTTYLASPTNVKYVVWPR